LAGVLVRQQTRSGPSADATDPMKCEMPPVYGGKYRLMSRDFISPIVI
jgi:hypothetical protein